MDQWQEWQRRSHRASLASHHPAAASAAAVKKVAVNKPVLLALEFVRIAVRQAGGRGCHRARAGPNQHGTQSWSEQTGRTTGVGSGVGLRSASIDLNPRLNDQSKLTSRRCVQRAKPPRRPVASSPVAVVRRRPPKTSTCPSHHLKHLISQKLQNWSEESELSEGQAEGGDILQLQCT